MSQSNAYFYDNHTSKILPSISDQNCVKILYTMIVFLNSNFLDVLIGSMCKFELVQPALVKKKSREFRVEDIRKVCNYCPSYALFLPNKERGGKKCREYAVEENRSVIEL